MKPIRISIKNYKSYGDKEYELDLSVETIRLVIGKSGSGKTSFVDAIMWCLYGKSISKTDKVVNRKNKKNCKVEFDFKVDNDDYSVVRYRKDENFGNSLFLYKNNKNISTTSVTDTQSLIQDIIGISFESMRASVIFSSELYLSFMRERESTRLKIFEGILLLRIVNKWADSLKKTRKPLLEEVQSLKEKKGKVEYGIEMLNTNIKNYNSKVKENLNKLKKEKENLEEEKKNLDKEIEEISHIDVDTEREKNRRYNEVKEHNSELDSQIEEKEKQKKKTVEKEQRIGEIDAKLSKVEGIDVDAKIHQIETYNKAVSNNQSIRAKISENNSKIVDTSKIDVSINGLFERKSTIENEVDSFLHAKVCPTCKQEISDTIIKSENLIDSRQNEAKELDEKIEDLKQKKEDAEVENKKIRETVQSLEDQLEDVDEEFEFENSPEELRRIEKEKTNLQSERKLLSQEIDQINYRNAEIDEEISKTKQKKVDDSNIYPSNYNEEYLENLSIRNSEIANRKKEIDNEINTVIEKLKTSYDKEYVEELKSKKTSLKSSLTKTSNKLDEKKYLDEHYEFLLNLFSNKESGLKKDFIQRMIPVFNNKINRYLPLFIDENVHIEFDKNLSEKITINDEEVDFDEFSSGEKKRFDLAIAFSLFYLVKEFFSSSVSFVIFDEILDGGLDDISLKKVLEVVNMIGETNSVLIISHNDNLKEWFNNHINISKDNNGYSRIENYGD